MEGFGGLGKIRGMLRFDIFFPLYVLLLYVFFFSISVFQMLLLCLIVLPRISMSPYHTFSIMLLLKFLYLVCIVIRFQVSYPTVIKGTADQLTESFLGSAGQLNYSWTSSSKLQTFTTR